MRSHWYINSLLHLISNAWQKRAKPKKRLDGLAVSQGNLFSGCSFCLLDTFIIGNQYLGCCLRLLGTLIIETLCSFSVAEAPSHFSHHLSNREATQRSNDKKVSKIKVTTRRLVSLWLYLSPIYRQALCISAHSL